MNRPTVSTGVVGIQDGATRAGEYGKGELQKNMQIEVSPTFDKRDKRVTYMECFGRLMAGIARVDILTRRWYRRGPTAACADYASGRWQVTKMP